MKENDRFEEFVCVDCKTRVFRLKFAANDDHFCGICKWIREQPEETRQSLREFFGTYPNMR